MSPLACPTCFTPYTKAPAIGGLVYHPGCKCPDEKTIRIPTFKPKPLRFVS